MKTFITFFLDHLDTIVKIAQIISYVLTPLIAIFVARVTLRIQRRQVEMQTQQTATNQSQHRFTLMEKRMQVYKAVNTFIAFLLTGPRFSSPGLRISSEPINDTKDIFQYVDDTSLAGVLFGEEIQTYIETLHGKALRLYLFHTDRVEGQPIKQEYTQERQDILVWVSHQTPEVRKLFLPYLDFRTP